MAESVHYDEVDQTDAHAVEAFEMTRADATYRARLNQASREDYAALHDRSDDNPRARD